MSTSPEFKVAWRDVTSLRPATTTGDAANRAQKHDRPWLVYVYDSSEGSDADARYAIESHKSFSDESVLVGARFFDCVRIELAQARADVALRPHVGKAPCLLAVRPNGEVCKSLRKLTAERVFSAMRTTIAKDFTNVLSRAVKEQRDCLKRKQKLARERERLERLGGEELAAAERELEKKEKSLASREAALYELRPKKRA